MKTIIIILALIFGNQAHAQDDLYTSAIRVVQDRYLFPESVTAQSMLSSAVKQLTDNIAWLMAEDTGSSIIIYDAETWLGEVSVTDLNDLPRALSQLESIVASHSRKVDDDLEIHILKGAIESLDRPSTILTGERLESFNERLKGTLTGIGAKVGSEDGEIIIRSVFEGGPADLAGLQAGDIVLSINDISTTGMHVTDATDRIRGEENTEVILHVLRGKNELDVVMIRKSINIPNLEYETLPSGVGWIKIDHFSEQTVTYLRRALSDLASDTALERGLVLDLRGNTGGSLIQAARSADQFLVEGMLVRTAGRDGIAVSNLIRQLDADYEGTEPSTPLVVLIDSMSASGSEILAGSLALLDRAVLIGERSYGKGTVQKVFNLRKDVRLKLTVAEYLLVEDFKVNKQGLVPDISTGEYLLGSSGVRIKAPINKEDGDPILFVRELQGWQEQEIKIRQDPVLSFAEEVCLASMGPTRQATLEASKKVSELASKKEDDLLIKTYSYRGIDWSHDPAPPITPIIPDVSISLEPDGPLLAGSTVQVRAHVQNLTNKPLYRVEVALYSENSLFSDKVIPIGKIPPNGDAEGKHTFKISSRQTHRYDEVTAIIKAEGYISTAPQDHFFEVKPISVPQLRVKARIEPIETGHRAILNIRNTGETDLRDLRVRFDFPANEAIRLLQSEAMVDNLRSGKDETVTLDLVLGNEFQGDLLPLEVQFDAESFGRLAHWDFPLYANGIEQTFEAPITTIENPLVGNANEQYLVKLQSTDDKRIKHAIMYFNSHKTKYCDVGAKKFEIEVPVTLSSGSNVIATIVEDDQGLTTKQWAYIYGVIPEEDQLDIPLANESD